ncbi:MAG: HPr family phosphocarrier protein [Chloroflexota bacterium]|nr:MAG: HPr family phosphocarrier protein [Chloroflexota bacterium]
MLSQEVVIRNRSGLHARPAACFVEEAKRFQCDLSIDLEGRKGNCKSVISLLKLGINAGATVRIEAAGCDEEAALSGLIAVLNRLTANEGES